MGKANEGISARWKHLVSSVSIIGPNGQLGSDLVKRFTAAGWEVKPVPHSLIAVEDFKSTVSALEANKADWIINKLEDCEKYSEKAWQVNAFGPLNVARAAKLIGSRCVFISSDYVFSGDQDEGSSYAEEDALSPLNVYGHSKAAGEVATLASDDQNLVVRVASLFGSAGSSGKGGNFIQAILNKAKNGESLKVVNDIRMSPTYTIDAATVIEMALSEGLSGKLHATNIGSVSWYEFARQILDISRIDTDLIPTESDFLKAPIRPKNSVLNVNRAMDLYPLHSDWKSALDRYLYEKKIL